MACAAGWFAPAVGGGDGAAVRALSRGGDGGGRPRRAVCVRAGADRPAAAAVRRAGRAHRGQLAAASGHGGRPQPVRPAGAGAAGVRPDRARAENHRAAEISGLLPGGARHHPVLPGERHPGPGQGIGGQLGGLLRPRRHQRRPGRQRVAVRAVPVAGARRAAGHRHRHRIGSAGERDPVRLRPLRPRLRRPGRQRHHLPRPQRGARHGPRAGVLAGAAGRLEQADQPVGKPGRVTPRRGHPRTGDRPGHADLQPAAAHGHPLRRHGDLRPPDRRRVPGGMGADGEPQRAAVGQRRLCGNRFGEVRPAGPRHALGTALLHRPGAPSTRASRSTWPSWTCPSPRCTRCCSAPTPSGCSRWSPVRRWPRCPG